jgi:NAD(P)-dependent dehydrogenase (short-subunit alcohol dehydrogenase family)
VGSQRDGRVAGKIALVTGAANGLGRAIALRLAEEGATLVLTDIDAEGLAETERQLKAANAGSNLPPLAVTADVTEEAPVKALFEQTLDAHGRLDILVNDVGGGTSGRIWEAKLEDWDHIIKLNLRSAFLCTREAAAHMRERRSGCIINLSSGAREGTPWTAYYIGNSAYSAAKAGIHGFTRGVALELAEYGVRVNAVAPGPIETERTGPGFRKLEGLEYGPVRATPMRRIGLPEDIANAVLYLASDEANYITGTTLPVAGGR